MANKLLSLGRLAYWRLYQDFLMSNRNGEYEALLVHALDKGYKVVSVEQWAQLLAEHGATVPFRVMIMRHDVDTDEKQTLESSEVEQRLGVGASYFFRWLTMSPQIIEQVSRRGLHTSYHFEEVADFAKRHRLRSAEQVVARMPEIRDMFAANVDRLRRQFGWSMRMVCSHGDWLNRRLGIRNLALLEDRPFRQQMGIEWETYDEPLMKPMAAYFSDVDAPRWWKPSHPMDAVSAGVTPIGILTHPKQWRADLRCNAVELYTRISEGLAYRMS